MWGGVLRGEERRGDWGEGRTVSPLVLLFSCSPLCLVLLLAGGESRVLPGLLLRGEKYGFSDVTGKTALVCDCERACVFSPSFLFFPEGLGGRGGIWLFCCEVVTFEREKERGREREKERKRERERVNDKRKTIIS